MTGSLTALPAQDEAFVSLQVEAFTARGDAPADALDAAAEWDTEGETEIGDRYREIARRLQAALDADLVAI